jgi:hypothetical protein
MVVYRLKILLLIQKFGYLALVGWYDASVFVFSTPYLHSELRLHLTSEYSETMLTSLCNSGHSQHKV